MRKSRHVMVLVVAVVLHQGTAFGQALKPAEEIKTSRSVLETSREGKSQDLFVVLDYSDLQERAARRRAQGGSENSDAAILEEWKKGAEATRNQVFPGKRFLGAQVLEEFDYSTTVLVRVPDRRAVEAILRHPKVISVQERKDQPPVSGKSVTLHTDRVPNNWCEIAFVEVW